MGESLRRENFMSWTKIRTALVAAIAIAFILVGLPAFAHHGTAAFDVSRSVTVKGVVTDFQYINPHVQVYFDVKGDNGEMEKWQAEFTAPNKLSRAGWTKRTLKPGDAIEITGNPAKNGAHTLWVRKFVGPEGPLAVAEE
jgi:hypothetical protein